MINYEVIPLRGNNQIDINGVRFNGKSFMFWKNKRTQDINEVIVVFNDKNSGNLELRDGVAILSLRGLTNYQDLKNAMMIFLQIMKNNQINVQLHFLVENENQRQIAEALGKEIGLSYAVQDVDQNREQEVAKMEEQLKKNTDSSLNVNGNHMIEKNDNGILKKITVHNGNVYENNGLLDSEEEKISLLREWMKDSFKAQELMKMSEAERNEMLTQAVLDNKKQYRLENVDKQSANDKVGEVAMNVANAENGLMNAELGIVQHTDSRANQYSAVEKNGDDVQVISPNVTQTHVSSNNGLLSNNTVSGVSAFRYYNDIGLEKKEEFDREVSEQVFYIDEVGNILDNSGEAVGKVNYDGYRVNSEDNSLLRYDNFVGYIGNYKDMGKSISKDRAKVKRLVKSEENEKSAAFVSFPVVMFILSALLLIGSVLLLFVLD